MGDSGKGSNVEPGDPLWGGGIWMKSWSHGGSEGAISVDGAGGGGGGVVPGQWTASAKAQSNLYGILP